VGRTFVEGMRVVAFLDPQIDERAAIRDGHTVEAEVQLSGEVQREFSGRWLSTTTLSCTARNSWKSA